MTNEPPNGPQPAWRTGEPVFLASKSQRNRSTTPAGSPGSSGTSGFDGWLESAAIYV